jgi:hypothetical protein
VGRFPTVDPWEGDYLQPLSLNRWVYVAANPILQADPSGLQPPPGSPTAEEEVIRTSSSNVQGLIRLFEVDGFPGNNAKERLQWILERTAKIPGSYLQFGLFPPGDSGFCYELGDARFYTDPRAWANFVTNHESGQVGHFLTAVALGFNPEGAYYQAFLLQSFSIGREGAPSPLLLPPPWGAEMYALSLIVGHEMVGDTEELMGLPRVPPQYYAGATSAEAVGLFLKAIEADRLGRTRERDTYLQPILGDPLRREVIPGPERIGNSMPDLRLSIKGWRFGKGTRNEEEGIRTRQDAANWLRREVYDPSRTR